MRHAMSCSLLMIIFTVSDVSAGQRKKVMIDSSYDGTAQPCYVILPEGFDGDAEPAPLLVSLHTWSGDVEQRNQPREQAAQKRGWIYLFPHFRGRNDDPLACGSDAAQQDVLDAVEWAKQHYPIDEKRIYLIGASGGGHFAMLLAGRHPKMWAAVSAWVGISDLAAWHDLHKDDRYGAMLRACCGGAPGDSEAVDDQYRQRSPLTHLHGAAGLPLDIAAGVHDGHQGSVPVGHSLRAFNVVAKAAGEMLISEKEIAQINRPNGRLRQPQEGDELFDPVFRRQIYLRRQAGQCRVSIFEGGHVSLDEAGCQWLSQHKRP